MTKATLLSAADLARAIRWRVGLPRRPNPADLERMAEAGEIPALALQSDDGRPLYLFNFKAVERALLARAHQLPAETTPAPAADPGDDEECEP